jgi:transposase
LRVSPLDLGIGVEVCWPYRPQEKGSVENLVGWVKGSFFKQRRFLDLDALFKRLHLANARRVWRGLIDRAERERWSYRDVLTLLTTEEIAHRQQPRLAR